jgi:hypothetical protein
LTYEIANERLSAMTAYHAIRRLYIDQLKTAGAL